MSDHVAFCRALWERRKLALVMPPIFFSSAAHSPFKEVLGIPVSLVSQGRALGIQVTAPLSLSSMKQNKPESPQALNSLPEPSPSVHITASCPTRLHASALLIRNL